MATKLAVFFVLIISLGALVAAILGAWTSYGPGPEVKVAVADELDKVEIMAVHDRNPLTVQVSSSGDVELEACDRTYTGRGEFSFATTAFCNTVEVKDGEDVVITVLGPEGSKDLRLWTFNHNWSRLGACALLALVGSAGWLLLSRWGWI